MSFKGWSTLPKRSSAYSGHIFSNVLRLSSILVGGSRLGEYETLQNRGIHSNCIQWFDSTREYERIKRIKMSQWHRWQTRGVAYRIRSSMESRTSAMTLYRSDQITSCFWFWVLISESARRKRKRLGVNNLIQNWLSSKIWTPGNSHIGALVVIYLRWNAHLIQSRIVAG